MNRSAFDQTCAKLKASENVHQWGNASVWKVGGKIFAICSTWGDGRDERISFKCSELAFAVLTEREGISPAPYLGRYKWVQLQNDAAMDDDDVSAHIKIAYELVVKKLTRKKRAELKIQ